MVRHPIVRVHTVRSGKIKIKSDKIVPFSELKGLN